MLKRGRKYIAIFIAALVLLLGIYSAGFIENRIVEESVSHLEEIYSQINASFSVLVSNNWNMLDDWKYHIGHAVDESEEKLHEFLQNGKENWNFTDFYFLDAEGNYRSFLGQEGIIDLGSQLEAVTVERRKIVVEGHLADGSALTIFAVPVERGYYRGLEYSAIAVGYNSNDLKETLNIEAFHEQSEYYVVCLDGRILFATKNEEIQGGNLLKDLKNNARMIDYSVEQVISDFAGRKDGVVRFEAMGDIYYMVYYTIGFQEWMTVGIVPELTVNASMNHVRTATVVVFTFFFLIVCTLELMYLVSRRKKAIREKDLEIRFREKLFGVLTNNVDDIFVMFSSDGLKVDYVSPNVEALLGVTSEAVKKDINALNMSIVNKEHILTKEILLQVEIGDNWQEEGEFIQQQTGEQRWYQQTVHHVSIEEKDRFILELSDRTKERQINQKLQQALDIAQGANEAKSNFLANMSHDMRTPMNAIIGYTTLLEKDAEQPNKVKEYTQKIMASSYHLLGLINDVLDMGKIESGRTALKLSEFNLAILLEEINTVMLPQARAKNQKFSIRTYGLYQELFVGDRVRIQQILMNLVSNAVKYTPEGGEIELHIYNRNQTSHNYARLRFEVRDTGIGMSSEFKDMIFEPFTREANTTLSGIQGTGLGMAIAKNLVDLMGGTIFVESSQGVGSTFTVDLELRISKQMEGGDFWKKHGIYSMLVVDGDEDVCVNIQNLMVGTSVYVQYALDGYTALKMIEKKMLQNSDYSLILLAWKLPEMDGIETAKRIRGQVGNQIPILVLTEYDWSEVEEDAKQAGINAFLQKPFFISNFRQVVEQLHSGEEYGEEDNGKPKERKKSISQLNFLIAEDNQINAEIITELLGMEGAKCDLAQNGKIALEMFENSKPGYYDIILMDIQMPVMDGYHAAREIRACAHPDAKTIPIAAMTANAFAEDVQRSLSAGMNIHISKPVNMDVLKSAVLKLV